MKTMIIIMLLMLIPSCFSEAIIPQIIDNIQESGYEELYDYSTKQREELINHYKEINHLFQDGFTDRIMNSINLEIMNAPTSINLFFVDSTRFNIDDDDPSSLVSSDAFFDGIVLSVGLRTHLYRAENPSIALLSETLSIYDYVTYDDTFQTLYILTYYADNLPEFLTTFIRATDNTFITKTQIINPEPQDIKFKSELIINTIYSLHEDGCIRSYQYKP